MERAAIQNPDSLSQAERSQTHFPAIEQIIPSVKRFSSLVKDILLSRDEKIWATFSFFFAEVSLVWVINNLDANLGLLLIGTAVSAIYTLILKGLDTFKKEKRLHNQTVTILLGVTFALTLPLEIYSLGLARGITHSTMTFSGLLTAFLIFNSFLSRNPKRFLIMGIPSATTGAIHDWLAPSNENFLKKYYRDLGQTRAEKYPSTICITREGVDTLDSLAYLRRAIQVGINIIDEKEFFIELFGKAPVFGTPQDCNLMIGLNARLPFSEAAMRLFDLVIAVITGILVSPLLLMIAITIRLTSPGPVLFIQKRQGRGNAPFNILKFRTMRDSDPNVPQPFTRGLDPRVTLVGRLLRHFHLDELPQLWNVIRGEMSLVGPRPEALHFAKKMQEFIPAYDLRYCVRPGITGLAQLNQGYAGDSVEATLEKLSYDFYYLKKRNLWLDLSVLLRTLFFIWHDTSYLRYKPSAKPENLRRTG